VSLVIGVDIGGTFTDLFCYNKETGEIVTAKVPSTPPTFVDGVLNVLKKAGIDLANVWKYIWHGSTVADNMLIERKLPKMALITTKGFRDILEVGRWWRGELYDLQWDKPAQVRPFVERKDIFEVDERICSDGSILKPLNEEEAIEIARKIRGRGYESVAIFFINSYVNPEHEKRMAEILRKEYPNVYISVAAELLPIIRELPRLSTCVLNAAVLPALHRYIGELIVRLRECGFKGELLIIQSNGGVVKSDLAVKKPIYVATSGPTAGVIAAIYMAKLIGVEDIISFDMGGTTAKICVVKGWECPITTEFHLEWDIPIAVPMVDMIEIGAGGGSIAWIDRGGMLRVGPQSAGAVPGPVCYLRGGTEPTVTDANLVLERLNSEYFLGGEMKVDKEAAKLAIKEKIADPLGIDTYEAAMGIINIVNTNMITAFRSATMRRGYDPRDFTLIAFGGAGPMHCAELARELGISKIVIPLNPGVFSAFGMCVTDFIHDFVATYFVPIEAVDLDKLNTIYQELERKAFDELRKEGVPEGRIIIQRFAKMKYVGEPIGGGIEVSVPLGILTKKSLEDICEKFHETHERLYTFSVKGEPIYLVDLRVRGIGVMDKPKLKEWPERGRDASKALKGKRKVYLDGDFQEIPIYDRNLLEPGNTIAGPAIIEEVQSTTVVPSDFELTVDRYKNLILTSLRGE
jgi:N-methylhydantoinase A